MFKFLDNIDHNLYERYLTLERNIKARSNSFYDAYLDLQEHFVKLVLAEQAFEIKVQETCGAILRKAEVRAFFMETLQIDEYTYNKMQDYTLKVNAHKHKGEKTVQIETIVNYLRVFYNAASAYANSKAMDVDEFDASYYISIFGIFEKENSELRCEMQQLKEELATSVAEGKLKDSDIATYQGLLSRSALDKLSLEEQNAELHKQISKLKDIKLSSMEDKLNRTIEMLLSLQESVVENRAVSYAVGDTICGSERFKEYVDQAKENINIDNIFGKIDNQNELINQVAEKLNGISIKDLYALARRTWQYQDYEMAQKYYNHISLLNPMDWEAPFCASLCGEMGRDIVSEWEHKPSTVFGYYKSTVYYLLGIDLADKEKVDAITNASRIFMDVLKRYEDVYTKPENTSQLDKYAPTFKSEIQNTYVNMIQLLSEIPIASFDEIIADVSVRHPFDVKKKKSNH